MYSDHPFMMKNYLFWNFFLVFVSGLTAQSFIFDPDSYHEKPVSAYTYSSHSIFMKNLTGGELVLGWELISQDLPPAWDADLCDFISCYPGIPDSGVMMAISDTTRGFLRIILNPNDKPGSGTVVFKVFDHDNPETADTCTFVIHAGDVTSVLGKPSGEKVRIFPVPADHDLIVEASPAFIPAYIKIFDVHGHRVLEQSLAGERTTKISTRQIHGGVYLVFLTDEQGNKERRTIIIR